MAGTTMITKPECHALIMPQNCDCGMCTPTWARRQWKSRQFSEPVTLVAALGQEDAAARPAMVEQHRTCLTAMVAALRVIAAEPRDVLGAPELGPPVLLFASELAAAIQSDEFRSELPDSLIRACEQTVTAATLAAAGCLARPDRNNAAHSALAG
jgi:hypothetical protein